MDPKLLPTLRFSNGMDRVNHACSRFQACTKEQASSLVPTSKLTNELESGTNCTELGRTVDLLKSVNSYC